MARKKKSAWDQLSMSERAQYIKLGVVNGIDLQQLRDTYNLYASGGTLGRKFDGTVPGQSQELPQIVNNQGIEDPMILQDVQTWEQEEQQAINSQKQWLQDWYDKRLPAIGKPGLSHMVNAGLQVPHQTRFREFFSNNPAEHFADAVAYYQPNNWGNSFIAFDESVGSGSTGIHEFNHAIQYGGSGTNMTHLFTGQPFDKNTISHDTEYYSRPEEQHSRIMELRYLNNLDPIKRDYTVEDVQNMQKGYNQLNGLREGGMTDDDIVNALNNWASNNNTFEQSNGMYLSAFGGNLKSTGGPLYPFSFEKNVNVKTPIVRYDNGGHLYGFGDWLKGLFTNKEEVPERQLTPEEIKADRVNRFVEDIWKTEYSVPKGYNPLTGLYFPYDSPEGGTQTIGPGFKLREDGSGDATMFTAEEAKKGVTKEQINEKLRAQGDLQYDSVIKFLNQRGNRLPVDTINPNIMNGLMDLRYQVGPLGTWHNLREAVLNGDLKGIKKESKTYYTTPSGEIKVDTRRNDLRAKKFWHYD